jgi:cell cycle checkpoint protein
LVETTGNPDRRAAAAAANRGDHALLTLQREADTEGEMPTLRRALSQLEGMGFGTHDASEALHRSNGDVQRAVELLTAGDTTQAERESDTGREAERQRGRETEPMGDDAVLAALDELLKQTEGESESRGSLPQSAHQSISRRIECSSDHRAAQRPARDTEVRRHAEKRAAQHSASQQVEQPARKRQATDLSASAAQRAREPPAQRQRAKEPGGWQWLARAGWQSYDPAVTGQLECSYREGESRIEVELGSSHPSVYVIDFEQMVQFPQREGQSRRRKIRRCAPPAAGPSRNSRHRQRAVLVSSDEGSGSDADDFEDEPARLRESEAEAEAEAGRQRHTERHSQPEASRRSKPDAKTKAVRKVGKSAAARQGQPSLADFIRSAQENRKERDAHTERSRDRETERSRRHDEQVLSQRTTIQQPAVPSVGNDSEEEIDEIEPSRSQLLPTVLRPAVATANSELWTDKYAPRSIEALAVHKSGVDRVRGWMRESLRTLSATQHSVRSSAASVLVLTGPPGSGKTSLVRLLAAELHCSVREWSSPVGASKWGSEEILSTREWHDQHRVPYEGNLEPLEHFLLGAAKYGVLPAVVIGSSSGSSSGPRGEDSSQDIILVEELPQLHKIEHRERFHALVRSVAERTRSPVVFIISSHRTGGSSNGSTGDATTAKSYFPESLLNHPQVTEHKLLEVNKTSLEKTLRSITLAESSSGSARGKGLCLAAIKAIVARCHGDVRSAVHSLQFESLGTGRGGGGGRRNISKRGAAFASASHAAVAEADDQTLGSRDVRLDMFRALGKILYNKRIDPRNEKSISAPDAARHAAAESLVRAELRRLPMKDDVENITDSYGADWPQLCEQLQQNYIDFFTQIEDVEVAASGLSDGALIGCWHDDRPAREIACAMAAAATVRAVRWANTAPSNATFRAFHYKTSFSRAEEQDANCRGADSFLVSSGVAGSGETTVRSRQARLELANYVQFMQKNGGLPVAAASTALCNVDDLEDEIDEIE